MVRKNDYHKKSNFQKDVVQSSEPANSNIQPRPAQKNGEPFNKENYSRSNRSTRDSQPRDNSQQRDAQQRDNQLRDNGQQRENPKRENQPRDNQPRENSQRDNFSRDNRENNHMRNFHRDNQNGNREQYRPHYQRSAPIKPRADETVEDISADIVRIEKEIELELKEIRSMRLGV